MLVTSTSCSGAPGTVALPPRSQMLSKTLSPGPSWKSPPASSWERAAQCPEISMPAPLTLPWHLTLCTDTSQPLGSQASPPLLPRMGSAEGAHPAQGWMPTRRTHGVGGSTVLGTQRAGWPEQSSHPSIGTARALSPPLSSCRHACCCPEASPPPQVPSQEGFSVHTSTRHWRKRGLDLRVSPACLPLTPVTPQRSRIRSDGGVMMKQGSSHFPHLSREL